MTTKSLYMVLALLIVLNASFLLDGFRGGVDYLTCAVIGFLGGLMVASFVWTYNV